MLILKPTKCTPIYDHAANIFRRMYAEVTGISLAISETDDKVSDLVVIGSDSVNDFAMNEFLDESTPSFGIRYGTDDYCMRSYIKNGRRILILAGGRGRSTVYAVYDFFERFAGCSYFWDGDVIPKKDNIEINDFDILEKPRFEYRGLRYFAHRGLKRFQAEHWSLEDWKFEIDWMMKKRLNFFMLRIGMDDVWQRAFPEYVKYPDEYLNIEDEKGYNDRSDFWTLKYRGELREKLLAYAREMDLIYPTDCGTMTHWYSRTPNSYLEDRKPEFAIQEETHYTEFDSGKVWNFLDKEYMDDYMHLTKTMVNEYEKRTDYFHTIGLGERNMFRDKAKNTRVKLVAYRRIAETLRENYPNSKLFIASWDFIGWWKSEDVQKLVAEFDPERTIILDYTSEVNDPEQSFVNWGVVNKFPWIFGLFHAYESESELRGPYDRSDERLRIAADDPYCKGLIVWPELSHSDPVMLEYVAENSWSPLKKNISEIVSEFCRKRYGSYADKMDNLWQKYLPFLKLGDWCGYSRRQPDDEKYIEYYPKWHTHSDLWVKIFDVFKDRHSDAFRQNMEWKLSQMMEQFDNVLTVLRGLANLTEQWNDEFFRRDAIDIIRTAASRFLNQLFISILFYFDDKSTLSKKTACYLDLLEATKKLLALSSDFSMLATLNALHDTAPTNPKFERTLKENIGNRYCRQPAYELMDSLFRREAEVLFSWMADHSSADEFDFTAECDKIFSDFLETPLTDMQPESIPEPKDAVLEVADCIEALRPFFTR